MGGGVGLEYVAKRREINYNSFIEKVVRFILNVLYGLRQCNMTVTAMKLSCNRIFLLCFSSTENLISLSDIILSIFKREMKRKIQKVPQNKIDKKIFSIFCNTIIDKNEII